MNVEDNRARVRGWTECLAAALLFGATTPILKIVTPSSSPLWSAGLLYIGAALAVAPLELLDHGTRLSSRSIARVAVAVLLGGCAAPVLLLVALTKAEALEVSLWLGLETVFTAVVSHVFFREHLSGRAWVANGLVVIAGALAAGGGTRDAWPGLLVVAACLCWALDNNLSASVSEVRPTRLVLLKGAIAGSITSAFAWTLRRPPPGLPTALATLVVGAVGYGASLVLYLRAARRLGAARSQMIFALAPLAGIALAWTLVGEPLTLRHLLAVGVFLGGLGLLSSERHAHPHVHEAVVHSHEHRHDDGHHVHLHPGSQPGLTHVHEHEHERVAHDHRHMPDVHHRHGHRKA